MASLVNGSILIKDFQNLHSSQYLKFAFTRSEIFGPVCSFYSYVRSSNLIWWQPSPIFESYKMRTCCFLYEMHLGLKFLMYATARPR